MDCLLWKSESDAVDLFEYQVASTSDRVLLLDVQEVASRRAKKSRRCGAWGCLCLSEIEGEFFYGTRG